MGWAAGFQAGTSMAKDWIDIYDKSNEKRGLKKVLDEQQVEVQAYDPKSAQRIDELQGQGYGVFHQPTPDGQSQYLAVPKPTQAEMSQFTNDLVVTPGEAASFATRPGSPTAPIGLRSQAPARPSMERTAGGGLAAPQERAPWEAPQIEAFTPRTQYSYNGQMRDTPMSDAELQLARQKRAAEVVMQYRPAEGLRMMMDAERAQREAELFPMQKRSAEQGVALTDYKLDDAEYAAGSRKRIDSFMAELPKLQQAGMSVDEMRQVATEQFKLNGNDLLTVQERALGLEDGALKWTDAQVKSAIHGKKTLREMLDLHANHPLFKGDGIRYVTKPGANGGLVLVPVTDDAEGKPAGSPLPFENEAQAFEYLRTAATKPENLSTFYEGIKDNALKRRATTAGIAKDYSYAAYLGRLPQDKSSFGINIGGKNYPKGSLLTGLAAADGTARVVNALVVPDPNGGLMLVDEKTKKAIPSTFVPTTMADLNAMDKSAEALVGKWTGRYVKNGGGDTVRETYTPESARAAQLQQRAATIFEGVDVDGGPAAAEVDWSAPVGSAAPTAAGAPAASGNPAAGLHRPPSEEERAAEDLRKRRAKEERGTAGLYLRG